MSKFNKNEIIDCVFFSEEPLINYPLIRDVCNCKAKATACKKYKLLNTEMIKCEDNPNCYYKQLIDIQEREDCCNFFEEPHFNF